MSTCLLFDTKMEKKNTYNRVAFILFCIYELTLNTNRDVMNKTEARKEVPEIAGVSGECM